MRLFPLAYAAGLLPLITIHLCYFLAASHGQVPWCIPYIDSCTSISATGRQPPAYFVFKGLMIPAALLLMAYWLFNPRWLRQLGCLHYSGQASLLVLGVLASSGLIFYSVLLGAIGPEYRQLRHSGVVAFFGFSFFAQLLLSRMMQSLTALTTKHSKLLSTLKALLLILLIAGSGHALLGYFAPPLYDASSNAVAWCFTLLLCLYVLINAELWRQTGWQLQFTVAE